MDRPRVQLRISVRPDPDIEVRCAWGAGSERGVRWGRPATLCLGPPSPFAALRALLARLGGSCGHAGRRVLWAGPGSTPAQ